MGAVMNGPGGAGPQQQQPPSATQQAQLPSQDYPDRMAEAYPAMGAGRVTGGMR